MLQALASLSALFFGLALLLAGLGLQGTLLPLRATMEHFSDIEIGLMGAAYFTGFVFGSLRTSYLVRAVGHIRVFAAMVVIISAVPLLHALIITPASWLALRAINGFCMAGVYLVIESWLNERTTNERRGTLLAIYTALNLAAITAGQLLLPLYDPANLQLFLVASILVSLAAVPVALSTSPSPTPITKVSFRFMPLIYNSPVGIAGCAVAGLVSSAFWTFGPAFGLNIGLSITGVSIFMSVIVIGGALGQLPFGYLSDRYDRRKVLLFACILSAVAAGGLYAAAFHWRDGLFIPAFFFGAASFPIYAVAVSHANDRIATEDFVETSSGLLLTHGLASAVGPLFASGAILWFGQPGVFLFMSAALVVAGGFVMYRTRWADAPPVEHQASYVPMTASLAVVNLDPRAEEDNGETAADSEDDNTTAASSQP